MQELNLTPSQTAIFFIVGVVILLVMILSEQTLNILEDFNRACEDNEKASSDLIKANEELRQTIIASRQGAYLQIEHH